MLICWCYFHHFASLLCQGLANYFLSQGHKFSISWPQILPMLWLLCIWLILQGSKSQRTCSSASSTNNLGTWAATSVLINLDLDYVLLFILFEVCLLCSFDSLEHICELPSFFSCVMPYSCKEILEKKYREFKSSCLLLQESLLYLTEIFINRKYIK